MEEVEKANRAAVESCNKVLGLLSQPQDQIQRKKLMVETGEAVIRFNKVVSLLHNGLGHARVRKSKNFQTPLPQNILLDKPNSKQDHPSKPFQFHQSNSLEKSIQDIGSNSKNSMASLELTQNGKSPLQLSQLIPSSTNYHQFLLQQQRLQPDKMYRRSNSGINLNFDSSSCTPTMSSTRSFISSLSVDGSVAKLDGSAFHLIGPARSDQNSFQPKRKCSRVGEEGSVKCGSSSRCHCSKKRKNRVKRSIKVPAISTKLADIPSDEYSWRKYGQKPIKGSPHPRGYYKCSSMRGCPARKHVERCLEDPAMLVVTYEGEHNHPKLPSQSGNQ